MYEFKKIPLILSTLNEKNTFFPGTYFFVGTKNDLAKGDLLRVLKELFALGNEVSDNSTLGLQLGE